MTEKKSPDDPKMSNVAQLAAAQRKQALKKRDNEGRAGGDDGRPLIRLSAGELPRILDEADAALGKQDATIFRQHTRLVRVTAFEETKERCGIRRYAGAVVIQQVASAHLVDRLALVAKWERWDKRADGWVTTDVPRTLAESFLARAGSWRTIPQLVGVIEAPNLRQDGSVLDSPGYDSTSGIFFSGQLPVGYTPPSTEPSRDEALEALDMLRAAIWDFPVVSEADRSAVISGLLTALFRRALPSAPMLAITAPTAGTGKSKLANVIAIITTGRRAPVLSLGDDPSEGEKRLAAALLAGDAIILLDNIERPLFGDLLCQVLSEQIVNLRPLGGSALVTLVTNCAFIATGNNLDIRGDLKRRILLARLDAQMERPELRKFERDVIGDVTARRGELVRAALTIVRAYLCAGSPAIEAPPFGGFEEWDTWCRRPLIWLGQPDPLLSSEEVRVEDPDVAMQRALFSAWDELFRDDKVRADQISNVALAPGNSHLHEALSAVCGEKITARRIGNWLRRHRGRMVDGHKVERAGIDPHTKIALWRLVNPAESAG